MCEKWKRRHKVKGKRRNPLYKGTWSHLFDGVVVYEMMVVFVEVAVQADTVTLEEQVLQCVDSCDT